MTKQKKYYVSAFAEVVMLSKEDIICKSEELDVTQTTGTEELVPTDETLYPWDTN